MLLFNPARIANEKESGKRSRGQQGSKANGAALGIQENLGRFRLRLASRGSRRSLVRRLFSFFRYVRRRLLKPFRIPLQILVGRRRAWGSGCLIGTGTARDNENARKRNGDEECFHKPVSVRGTR